MGPDQPRTNLHPAVYYLTLHQKTVKKRGGIKEKQQNAKQIRNGKEEIADASRGMKNRRPREKNQEIFKKR